MSDLLLRGAVPEGETCEGCGRNVRCSGHLATDPEMACDLFRGPDGRLHRTKDGPCPACLAARRDAVEARRAVAVLRDFDEAAGLGPGMMIVKQPMFDRIRSILAAIDEGKEKP